MVQLTPVAVTKVKEILTQQNPSPTGLRVAVVGGGCSGFSYHMAFENAVNENSDNVYEFDGLKVLELTRTKRFPRSRQKERVRALVELFTFPRDETAQA